MYYDYDFSQMVDELQDLNTTADQILTEIKANEEAAELRQEEITSAFTLVTMILVISIAVKVMFK